MKSFAEIMTAREATPEERETIEHVMSVARSWHMNGLPLESVRVQCSGRERWTAMRFLPVGSADKLLLMEMVDALCDAERGGFQCKHGYINFEDEVFGKAAAKTNALGERVWVWAMHYSNGQPVYPLIEVEDRAKRNERQTAATAKYNSDANKRRGGPR
jgi:hypothetical protein